MSIYSNVTEQGLINLRKLAEQQKNQRAERIKNRILKQTHDVKLAESLSPITSKLDETSKKLGDESTQNLGDVIKRNNTPQPAIENTPTALPIESEKIQPGAIYSTSLENTLSNMKEKEKGYSKIGEDKDGQRYWNGLPIQTPSDSIVEVKGKKFNITPNLQDVFTEQMVNL